MTVTVCSICRFPLHPVRWSPGIRHISDAVSLLGVSFVSPRGIVHMISEVTGGVLISGA